MKKKLISLAVAAAMTAPAAALADATLYGKLSVSLDYADVNNVILPEFEIVGGGPVTVGGIPTPIRTAIFGPGNYITPVRDSLALGYPILAQRLGWIPRTVQVPGVYQQVQPGEDFTGWGMSGHDYIPGKDRGSRIGVKGSEDLGGGLKAIYQIELGINLNDTNKNIIDNADKISYRNSYLGLAGNFGTIMFGRYDSALKNSTSKLDLFNDTMADNAGTVGFYDKRIDNLVRYVSPSFSGFQLVAEIVPTGGATAGEGLNLNSDSIAEGWDLAGTYSNGPFYASVAYESFGNELFNDQTTSVYFSDCDYVSQTSSGYDSFCGFNSEDFTAWRVGLGILDWNGFYLTGIYESRDNEPNSGVFAAYTDPSNAANSWYIPAAPHDAELWQIQAGYAFGNNMIKASYGEASYDSDVYLGANYVEDNGGALFEENVTNLTDYDVSTWAVGFDHSFSKRTKVYALYTEVDSDQENVKAGSDWSGFSFGMIHKF